MATEHLRPDGLHQGYYCRVCGLGGVNMLGMGRDHRSGGQGCIPNPELVRELDELNK